MSTVRAIQNQQEAYNRGVRASGSSSAGEYSAEEQALLAAADKEVDGLLEHIMADRLQQYAVGLHPMRQERYASISGCC